MNELFREQTVLRHTATLDYGTFETHIHLRDKRLGWARPSAFEIRSSLTSPAEIMQSAKDPTSYLYVRGVGAVGATNWFIVSILRTTDSRITTAYNTISYASKGPKVWPAAKGVSS